MSKIYTRTGDAGQTALFGGGRVSKADRRVAAYGEVDELNAALGAVLVPAAFVDELLAAARWTVTHDPSPGFRSLLVQTLGDLGVEDADAALA